MKRSEICITLPIVFTVPDYHDLMDFAVIVNRILCPKERKDWVKISEIGCTGQEYIGLVYKRGEKTTKSEIKEMCIHQEINQ